MKSRGGKDKESSDSRYLVTGAGGFVGGHMIDLLVARGHKVVATDLMESPSPDLPEGAEYVPADLTRPESLEAPFCAARLRKEGLISG